MQRFTSVYLWASTRKRLVEILRRDGPTVNMLLNVGVLSLTDAQIEDAMRDGESHRSSEREHIEEAQHV